jgi:asparagine synthase (glutamine-hydrolysing)
MCGIIGVFGTSRHSISPALFDSWRDRLSHRGPDQAATFSDRGFYLGFRRLAILDLSEAGNQPMTSADGRWTIVLNGEIYNFQELRSELEAEGVQFRSRSDTEVLLMLYAREGTAALSRLNGMYAFAIYDAYERTVLLARDRLGVKPLYYHRTSNTLAFASELRAIRDAPGFPSTIDEETLAIYFRVGAVPDWTSLFSGVRKLPPGTWIRFSLDEAGAEAPTVYWDLPPVGDAEDGRSENAWLDEIEALLFDATRIRLRSDVPLGVFLSGGIDSGLVAAAATKHVPGLSCFTVGFRGEPEDETPLAAASARHLGARLVTLDVDLRRGMTELPSIMGHFDEPFADTSALPTALICAEGRKELVVVLTGDAGDEVFGGYGNHVRAWQWRYLDRLPVILRQGAGMLLAAAAPPDSVARRFARRLAEPVGRFGMGAMLYPFEDWPDAALRPEVNISGREVVRRYAAHLPEWSGASAVDQSQRTDLRSYMLDDILVKVDRMSMRHSLELRSPFLDYRMVELGLRVPSRLRVRRGQNKYLLRRLAERHLPREVCAAPKRGFGVPMRSWIRDPGVATSMRTLLSHGSEGFPEPFGRGGAERLWQTAASNPAALSALVAALSYRWWCAAQGPR